MDELRVALLNASYRVERTERNFRRELAADVEPYTVTEGELPADHDFDAAVVSGSGASVYGDEPWVDPLADWVADAVDAGVPTLGVCFGHQLVASVLGGRVEAMGEYELGYREMDRAAASTLLDGRDDSFVAFATHSDRVVDLPPDATLTAENDYGVQAFRAEPAFGVQFHPEYDRDSASVVTSDKDLPDERVERALATITDENVAVAKRTKELFDRFLDYAARRRQDRPA